MLKTSLEGFTLQRDFPFIKKTYKDLQLSLLQTKSIKQTQNKNLRNIAENLDLRGTLEMIKDRFPRKY